MGISIEILKNGFYFSIFKIWFGVSFKVGL